VDAGVDWERSDVDHDVFEEGGASMNEWVIVGIVAIAVIFGATKLPEIARNLGRSSNEFKKGLKEGASDDAAEPTTPPEQPKPEA
jgi:sec-independent protein translocase protein TatA